MDNNNPSEILDQNGPAAPPRINGELVFESPWESRLFGLTMSLHEAGLFDWAEFRRLLIEEIGIWDVEEHPEEDWNYYEHWAAAFEKMLAKKNFCAPAELDGRVATFSSRPHGHNH
jgi:nitrile hydratase accessory protein